MSRLRGRRTTTPVNGDAPVQGDETPQAKEGEDAAPPPLPTMGRLPGRRSRTPTIPTTPTITRSLNAGDWVAAVHEGDWHFGQVHSGKDRAKEYAISFMERNTQYNDAFRWPVTLNIINIPEYDILLSTDPPLMTVHSGEQVVYTLHDTVLEAIIHEFHIYD